ncbi:hypothetical protein IC582_016483 [Cucumis melo]
MVSKNQQASYSKPIKCKAKTEERKMKKGKGTVRGRPTRGKKDA